MKRKPSFLEQKSNGYEHASEEIQKLEINLKQFPIEQFPCYWQSYCRTLKTTLQIIEEQANNFLLSKKR